MPIDSARHGSRSTGPSCGRRYAFDPAMSFAGRAVRAVSDVTLGTAIVLVHVALADHQAKLERRAGHARKLATADEERRKPE